MAEKWIAAGLVLAAAFGVFIWWLVGALERKEAECEARGGHFEVYIVGKVTITKCEGAE